MGDVIDLRGQSAHLEDDELIENLARFADGTLSEAAVKAQTPPQQRRMGRAGRERQAGRACRGLQAAPDTHRRHQKGERANRDHRRTADSRQNHARPRQQRTARH